MDSLLNSGPAVLYEDHDIVVLDKPSGLLVHAAKVSPKKKDADPPEPTLAAWLVQKYPQLREVGDDPAQRPGIVHRLDKETSGIMVVAKTQASFEHLKSLFKSREISKTYLALLHGTLVPEQGIIDAAIGIKDGTTKRSVHSTKMAKEAQTKYETREALGEFSLVEAHPLTGRTHQLRVHFASKGHPIVGDTLYGPRKSTVNAPRLMLHAQSLELPLSEGKRIKIEAPLPEDFFDYLQQLKLKKIKEI